MESLDPRSATPLDAGDPSAQASLHLELRVPDQRMLAAFREEFLHWLNDRSSPFARMMGAAASLSLNELPTGTEPRGLSSLRLTVTWTVAAPPSAGPGAVAVRGAAFAGPPAVRQPASAPPRPLTIDHFVFFPEPVQSRAPLFPAWSAQLITPDTVARKGAPAPRVELPVTVAMARQAGQALRAVRSWVGQRAEGLGISGLIIRSPSIARYPRAWGAGVIAAAAVAAGFTAGSIYLSSTPPTVEALATSPVALAAPPSASPRAEISASGVPPALSVAPFAGAAPSAAPARLAPAMVTSASLDIPDAEVTTRRVAVPPPNLPRRPAVVVPRTAEVTAVSSVPAESRRIKGALLVKSEPQGAEVSVNGIVHGRTPLVIRELGVGSRVVRLDLPGYARWSWAVPVVANRRTPVTVKLQPEGR